MHDALLRSLASARAGDAGGVKALTARLREQIEALRTVGHERVFHACRAIEAAARPVWRVGSVWELCGITGAPCASLVHIDESLRISPFLHAFAIGLWLALHLEKIVGNVREESLGELALAVGYAMETLQATLGVV
jgi:hypothetical protein